MIKCLCLAALQNWALMLETVGLNYLILLRDYFILQCMSLLAIAKGASKQVKKQTQ